MNQNIKNEKHVINRRDLKIEEQSRENNKHSKEVEEFRKSGSLMVAPLGIENLDKTYHDMITTKIKTEKNEKTGARSQCKKQQEKVIFYDIFIKPKENKIKEIKNKRIEHKLNKVQSTNSSTENNKIIIKSNKSCEKSTINDINMTNLINDYISKDRVNSNPNNLSDNIQLEADGETDARIGTKKVNENINKNIIHNNLFDYFKNDSIAAENTSVLYNYLQFKFIPSDESSISKKIYFNQLIQIRPPEGINAGAASPLIDSNKGWAPSIPSIQINKSKTNLNDLMIRAKGGIQAGDIPKEAHMAFFLGIMNEEEKRYEEALKFYKKYFLSAKLLEDPYGTELALNRIAVLYSNILDYDQSLYYNEKHKNITTHNLNGFVAYYNCGICHRILGKIEESIKSFETALEMSDKENDLESYTISLSQLALSNLFTGNLNAYFEYSEEFLNKNRILKNKEMELEMLIVNGYINNLCGRFDDSANYYNDSYKQATSSNNEYYKAISLCNMGIIEASKNYEIYSDSLNNIL